MSAGRRAPVAADIRMYSLLLVAPVSYRAPRGLAALSNPGSG